MCMCAHLPPPILTPGPQKKLEPFYEELLSLSFPDSVTAIDHCRHLCAQYGFTVKREASTHRVSRKTSWLID